MQILCQKKKFWNLSVLTHAVAGRKARSSPLSFKTKNPHSQDEKFLLCYLYFSLKLPKKLPKKEPKASLPQLEAAARRSKPLETLHEPQKTSKKVTLSYQKLTPNTSKTLQNTSKTLENAWKTLENVWTTLGK